MACIKDSRPVDCENSRKGRAIGLLVVEKSVSEEVVYLECGREWRLRQALMHQETVSEWNSVQFWTWSIFSFGGHRINVQYPRQQTENADAAAAGPAWSRNEGYPQYGKLSWFELLLSGVPGTTVPTSGRPSGNPEKSKVDSSKLLKKAINVN